MQEFKVSKYNKEVLLSKCQQCGFDDIRTLHSHHRDRNRKNNSKENIEILCANCHKIEHYAEDSLRIKNSEKSGNKKKIHSIYLTISCNKDRKKVQQILTLLKQKIPEVREKQKIKNENDRLEEQYRRKIKNIQKK